MFRSRKSRSDDVRSDSCPTGRSRPIALGSQDEIVLLILIGPQCATLGAEGAGAASHRLGLLRHGELGGAAVAASPNCHLYCLRSQGLMLLFWKAVAVMECLSQRSYQVRDNLVAVIEHDIRSGMGKARLRMRREPSECLD